MGRVHKMYDLANYTLASLYMSQVAHQAGAFPGFRSMERLGVFLPPPLPGWDSSPSHGEPQH